MTGLRTLTTERAGRGQTLRVASRPIKFEEYLNFDDPRHEYELLRGVLTKKRSAQLEHERLQTWLIFILSGYADSKNLGEVLGSRTVIEISAFTGRMPDLLFVREENRQILSSKAVYGAPDLAIEIASPNDRPSALRSLEADYREVGIQEIVFIDQRKSVITVLRKREAGYDVEDLAEGNLVLESLGGLSLQVEWILQEPRPERFALLTQLLASP